MSARKGLTVLAVNRTDGTATVRDTYGVEWLRHLASLDKSTLIKCGTFLKVKWGGTPMHKSREEILAIVQGSTPTVSSRPIVPMQPKVAPSAPVAPSVPSGSSLDAVIANMVHNILGDVDLKAGPDAETVERLDRLEVALQVGLEGMGMALSEVSDKVQRMAPTVTQIVVKDRPTVTLKGVQHEAFPDIMMSVAARENTFLVGPAGTGKTTIVAQVAEALGLPFHAENLTAATTEYTLKGYRDGASNYTATPLRTMFENGGVYLLDEIDNANPNTLGVLNSALSNGFMAFPDGMVPKHPDFVAIAAGNTFGNGADAQYVGRNPIDAATLDRFAFFTVGIDERVEDAMLAAYPLDTDVATKWRLAVRTARANVDKYGLRHIVSPRAMVGGAALLTQGMPMSKVFAARILKGAKQDQASKIMEGVVLS